MNFLKRLLVASLLMGGILGVSEAAVRDDSFVRDNSGTIRYRFDGITVSTSAVLIDLSNTTTWPHKYTGHVVITSLRVVVDKVANSTGTLKVGLATDVNATNGDVEWFYSLDFEDNGGTGIIDFVNYSPGAINAYADSTGATPFMLSADVTTDSTVYQTDVGLLNATGVAAAPGTGDIILRVDFTNTQSAGTDIVIEAEYYTER